MKWKLWHENYEMKVDFNSKHQMYVLNCIVRVVLLKKTKQASKKIRLVFYNSPENRFSKVTLVSLASLWENVAPKGEKKKTLVSKQN